MPRFTTASATRSSSARSSIVNTSAPDVVENAWDNSSRTLSHFSARDVLEKAVITVWKGSTIDYRAALYEEGERESIKGGIARPSFLLAERAINMCSFDAPVKDGLTAPKEQ